MIKLFGKKGCKKCDYMKKWIADNGYTVEYYDITTPDISTWSQADMVKKAEQLRDLAWLEGVALTETTLPIMIAGDEVVTLIKEMKRRLRDG